MYRDPLTGPIQMKYTFVCVCSAELIYKEVVDYERQSQQSSTAGVNNHITGK